MEERLALYTATPDANGCELWTGALDSSGYGSFFWKGAPRSTHKATWEMHNGPVPERMEVCHSCDVRSCRTLGHLFLGTHLENMDDMVAKGRVRTKLSDQQVLAILVDSRTHQVIANDYGVCRPLVSMIKSGKKRRRAQ